METLATCNYINITEHPMLETTGCLLWIGVEERCKVYFPKKVFMRLILYITSSNILLGYTDTLMGRRYAIGIHCFITDILWDEGPVCIVTKKIYFSAIESYIVIAQCGNFFINICKT